MLENRDEILRVAEEDNASIIVIGKSTRKVRGIRVMGSTARRMSRMSRIPVLAPLKGVLN
ncbi:MAG: hypothetical protein GQ542_04315 [Desulforhopalus sp.]|nr:hypothetical protein [Desulforhopalus sp.]